MEVGSLLKSARARLIAEGPSPGRAWCRAWTHEVDQVLAGLFVEAALTPGRLAVVAVGGYGRMELCPGSDIDVLLLVDGVDEEAQATAVKALVYPLWDAGLSVGHAVRSPRQAVTAAQADVDVATSLLDARLVAGDAELLRTSRQELLDKLRRKPDKFLSALTAADASRRARYGDTAEVLEPNLKEGAGGLRDIQSLRWAAGALLGQADLDSLVTARYLAAADRARLSRAEDRLLAVRVALHQEAGRAVDVLALGHQDAVGARLDFGPQGAEALLRDVFLTARMVDHVHRCAWALMEADSRAGRRRFRRPAQRRLAGGFAVADGVLRIEDEGALDDPAFPTLLLEALVESRAALDRHSAARISRFLDEGPAALERWPWDEAARQRFLDALWRGEPALDALAELDDLGLLTALVPEWDPLRGRPQRNPYHRFSLDRHALHAAANLAEMVARDDWAAERLADVDDRDALMLGVLLHDVGKAHGEPHTETGVHAADAITRRMGFADETRELVGRLVRLHLLLPEVATRRDLADPGLPAEVAARIEDRQTLACLHLLAAADGTATGPSAWTPWKAALVEELARKVENVLDPRPDDVPADGDATVREALRMASGLGVDEALVRSHLDKLPDRYGMSVSARAIVRHSAAAAEALEPTEVRTRVSSGGDEPVDELDVVALDRPGLFAKVAGVLALHGGSVLSAHAFTRSDGTAVDTFTVRRPDGTSCTSWWAAVEGDLVEAVAGRLALRARIQRKAAAQRRPAQPLPPMPVRVQVTPDSSGHATVVEVHTEDAIGVLHRIAAALAELELDIVVAKVDTIGRRAIDVFYVRDAAGSPLDDDHAGEVVMAVTAALEE